MAATVAAQASTAPVALLTVVLVVQRANTSRQEERGAVARAELVTILVHTKL